ncbi:hypothetical protein [Brevundimonas sp.]|uniref:hypothetical protein n=1 Tax=Brevundimonas sp. TaxID=1871086 RepID=UPI0025C0EE54|nr:hypothetical protein [Brevundimonas sp.]
MSTKNSMILATATLQDIISKGAAMNGSALRGDGAERQQPIREEAHALLDAYLDHMADAGTHARVLLKD